MYSTAATVSTALLSTSWSTVSSASALSSPPQADSVWFYEGKLRLRALRSGPSARIVDGGRVYGSGGVPALNVYQAITAGKSSATMATWYVDDIEAVVDQLTAAGVEFTRYDECEHDAEASPPEAAEATSPGSRTPTGTPSPSKPTTETHLTTHAAELAGAERGGKIRAGQAVGITDVQVGRIIREGTSVALRSPMPSRPHARLRTDAPNFSTKSSAPVVL
ncbi:VOC family protein [Streptomyces sp. TLI_171]|uniref:VOC family protein n=1 Tax=Streptomyces sp. TLI_171 TaxID=1938859 RepID=UPI001C5578D4|nr:hypothetical protein [Streptomyces sp. TLI_171]